MVFKIALNRCCCDEDICDVFKDVCRVTVTFSGVEQPTISAQNNDNVPPFIHPIGNPLSNAGECVITSQRADCEGWNREWEVFPIDCIFPDTGDQQLLCKLVAGQAGDGFTEEPDVYPLPPLPSGGDILAQAGSACFPCHEFGENAGLVLVLTCVNDTLGAALTLHTDAGCPMVTWQWNIFEPELINSNGSEGNPRASDRIVQNHYVDSSVLGVNTPCYTPRGQCLDKLDLFPSCRNEEGFLDDAATISVHDTKNCFWNVQLENFPKLRFYRCEASPPPLSPSGCDSCITQITHIMHADFAAAGGGIELPTVGAGGTYVEENYWTLTENNGDPGEVSTLASGDVLLTFPCWYEVFIRYSYPDFNPAVDELIGEVRIFNVQGSGGAELLDVDEEFEIDGANTDIDGDHNTHVIDEFAYQKIGTFQMHDPDAGQNWVRIQVEGPAFNGDSMIFDDIILRRL